MQKQTIVFVINRLKLGGAQRVAITLAHALQQAGHDAHIVCFKHSDELCGAEALNVHYFDRGLAWLPAPLRNRLLAKRLDAFIRARVGEPDLVLSNLSKANRVMVHSALRNVRIIVHNTLSLLGEAADMSAARHWLRNRRIRATYLKKPCICVSRGVYDDFVALMPEHFDVTTITNPVDTAQIRSWSQDFTSPYRDYVVHVGSFIPQKRHDLLLRAYSESGIDESLVLVGSGELEAAIRQQAQELGIQDKVLFAGFQSNPYPIIAGAKLLLLTSDYEGLGIVLLESLALGVPAISTDCESGPAEILPAQNLAPVGDAPAMARLLARAAASPQDFASAVPGQFESHGIAAAYLALCHV
ncbi:MAG: glycosyltransferase [Halioglobus sp.]|nr:glycosyltransferase [Halioglobus sp.]